MGGRAAGEIASRIAVCTVLEHFDRPRKSGNFPGSGEALEGISEGANARACAIHCESRDPLVLSSARGSRSYSPVQGPTG